MKYLILPMALISAFFVSESHSTGLDLDNLLSPKSEEVKDKCLGPMGKTDDPVSSCESMFSSAVAGRKANDRFVSGSEIITEKLSANTIRTTFKYVNCKERIRDGVCGMPGNYSIYNDYRVVELKSCPPDGAPKHIHSYYPIPSDEDSLMCAKELEPEPDPDPDPDPDADAKCDEFGNNSMLPPKSGVGSEGQNACYTNPSNGLSCQYVQGGDNFTATGKQCTGDENDYGDRPTPEPPPDGADPNCYNYGSQGQVLICDVDPNEGCNPLTINGTTQYQCPSGCGSIDGVYFCSYDDRDGDGIPDDKNGNGVPDKDETCVNGKCKPNTPDDTTPPTTEKPDMTETNTRLDGVIGELDSIGGKINKTNQTLNGINSGIQGIKQGQDKANGLLSGMSKDTGLIADNTDAIAGNTKGLLETVSKTDVGNTFNPDLSTGFYESSYENGFEGIWAEKSILFEQTETIQFLQQFRFNAGGSPPDTQLCFNMGGSMDFGCADLPTPSPQLLAILKIFILITAAFLCRALIFGG